MFGTQSVHHHINTKYNQGRILQGKKKNQKNQKKKKDQNQKNQNQNQTIRSSRQSEFKVQH